MREIKTARGNLHFQPMITAHQIERLRPGSPCQKGTGQRGTDWLHGGRFGARRQFTVIGEMLVFRVWICRGTRPGKSRAFLLVLFHFIEKLLKSHMRGNSLRLAGSKDRRRCKDPVSQQLRKKQEQ